MAASIRILSTQSLDSSPTVLVVSPDGSKTIVNCGEGCQRIFIEFSQKLPTVNRVCLTRLSHDAIGGLPGMILTTADVFKAAVDNAKAAAKNAKPDISGPLPALDIIGPRGTQQFIHSLRHFMRRDAFQINVHEGAYNQKNQSITKKRKRNGEVNSEYFSVEPIICNEEMYSQTQASAATSASGKTNQDQVLSFLFTTPPVQGKFRADKAKSLGIPPGPLYGRLKSGQSVSFTDKDGHERTVESDQVVEPGSPSITAAVLHYPSIGVLQQLQSSERLRSFKERGPNDPILEVVVHMAPPDLFFSDLCKEWIQSFGEEVEHIHLESGSSAGFQDDHSDNGTPFLSAAAGALSRGQISAKIYGLQPLPTAPRDSGKIVGKFQCTRAQPLLEYIIVPRPKRGFKNHSAFKNAWDEAKAEADEIVRSSAADTRAKEILESESSSSAEGSGCIIFAGTGSALPCKHRNVSGILLRMANGNSILLDVGEGTVGQILRVRRSEKSSDILKEIKAVWISHPHADHHLGIIRLLEERVALTDDPLTVIAPVNLNLFLQEYQQVNPSISGSYTFLNCRDFAATASSPVASEKLENDLGIVSCVTVPVAHCPNSFAVILSGTPFGSVAYSGDCRPSRKFAEVGLNADLLIHEATFANGMENEAKVKKHCTVGEALDIGRQMKATTVILTHFSQRYPKIPPLSSDGTDSDIEFPVVFAFDYLKLTPKDLVLASKLTPALRLLYPETEKEASDEELAATDALNIPGLFAQDSIL